MLHVVAFALVSTMFVVVAAGIAAMLIGARGKIERALRMGSVETAPVAPEPSRVRIVRTTRDRRIMLPLREAA